MVSEHINLNFKMRLNIIWRLNIYFVVLYDVVIYPLNKKDIIANLWLQELYKNLIVLNELTKKQKTTKKIKKLTEFFVVLFYHFGVDDN